MGVMIFLQIFKWIKGKIHSKEKIDIALKNFFKLENLIIYGAAARY